SPIGSLLTGILAGVLSRLAGAFHDTEARTVAHLRGDCLGWRWESVDRLEGTTQSRSELGRNHIRCLLDKTQRAFHPTCDEEALGGRPRLSRAALLVPISPANRTVSSYFCSVTRRDAVHSWWGWIYASCP